jgi:hypothetical protein
MKAKIFRSLATIAMVLTLVAISAGFKGCNGPATNSNTSTNSNTGVISTKQLDDLAKTSRELAHDVGLGLDAVTLLYKSNRITLQVKDQLADKFSKLSTAGRDFNQFLVRLHQQEKNGTLPANWQQLIAQEWATVFRLYQDVSSSVSTVSAPEQQTIQTGTTKLDQAVAMLQAALGKL